MNDNADNDPRLYAIPDIHGHAKGEHKAFTDERPIPLSARMLFLWFYHACRRGWPRFLMVTDHMNYLTFEDPAAINLVRRALKLAQAGDLYGAAETASVEVGHAAVVSEGLRRGMRYSIGAEVDNDPRSRPDAQNIVDAMKPDGMIRSVHFLTIDHPTHGPNWNWPFDNPEFADVFDVVGTAKTWELYMATLLDAIERLPGQIVGHFYVPAVFGHWPDDATLEAYEDRLIDACDARGMAIELNTRFLYRNHADEAKAKYLEVHRRLLRKCKERNVGIAVGSDAHSPKDQGRGFDAILALLDECEINELVFPIAGRLARVALRVERKADPIASAAPEPAAQLPAEDRKVIRKARTSEVPARSKDSSSKRDDAPSGEDTPTTDNAAPLKPRPKRSKQRAAASADDDMPDRPPAEEATSAGSADRVTDDDAVFSDRLRTEPLDEPLSADADDQPLPQYAEHTPQVAAEPETEEPLSAEFEVVLLSPNDEVEPVAATEDPGDDGSGDNAQADMPELAIDEGVLVETVAELVTEGEIEPIVTAVDDEIGGAASVSADKESDANEERVAFEVVPGVEIDVAADRAGDDSAADDDGLETAPEPPRRVAPAAPRSRSKPAAARPKSGASISTGKAAAKTKPAAKKPVKPVAKAGAKKTPAKKAAGKKASAKTVAVKKPAARKVAAKKVAARPAAMKKSGGKKASAKKTGAKKPAPKRR